jgi:hypothetical protein
MPPPRHGSGSTPSSANDWAPDVNSHGHAALRMTVTAIGRWSPQQRLSTAFGPSSCRGASVEPRDRGLGGAVVGLAQALSRHRLRLAAGRPGQINAVLNKKARKAA